MSDPRISEYGAGLDGTRAVGVEVVDGVKVLVTPTHESHNKKARIIAQRIADVELDAAGSRLAIEALQKANDTFAVRIRELRSQLDAEQIRTDAALTGRKRFFSPVLLVPAEPGNWKGAVWLQDPEKQGRGFGLRFDSVAEVHKLHPELWIIEVRPEGVLLDAWGGSP